MNVFEKNEIGDSGSNDIKFTFTIMSKKSTRADYLTSKGNINTKKDTNGAKNFRYLPPDAKHIFNLLWQAFTKAHIFQHFDLERHIRVETDASSHAIGKVPSQLILDNLGQWHSITYYLCKIISAKI